MAKPPAVLDYAPPPPSAASRFADAIGTASDWAWWFLWRRQLRALEVAFGGWAVFAVNYALLAVGLTQSLLGLATLFMAASMLAAAGAGFVAAIQLVRTRRYAAALLLAWVAIISALMGGMVQLERCPHATYLQIFGGSVAIQGKACHNQRNTAPWWWR